MSLLWHPLCDVVWTLSYLEIHNSLFKIIWFLHCTYYTTNIALGAVSVCSVSHQLSVICTRNQLSMEEKRCIFKKTCWFVGNLT